MTSGPYGGGCQEFWDDSTKASVQKCENMGEGVKNCPKLRDVKYG